MEGFSAGFSFQYFVSCGVFISWVVTNKARPNRNINLFPQSARSEKMGGGRRGGRKKRKGRLHFLLEISHTDIRCSGVGRSELPAAWNEIRLHVFDALPGGRRREPLARPPAE